MMKRHTRILGLLLMWFTPSWGLDTTVDLFLAQVPVASRSGPAWNHAASQGMRQVLRKLTASDQLSPEVLADADAMSVKSVQRYEYLTTDTQYQLSIHYSPDKVRHFLSDHGLTIWSPQRPVIVLWQFQTDPQGFVRPLDDDDQAITNVSIQYGLPILRPIDTAGMTLPQTPEDIPNKHWWDMSENYQPDAILVANYNTSLNQVDWYLYTHYGELNWPITPKQWDDTTILAGGIQHVFDHLKTQGNMGAPGRLEDIYTITVDRIDSLSDYHQLLTKLDDTKHLSEIALSHATSTSLELTALSKLDTLKLVEHLQDEFPAQKVHFCQTDQPHHLCMTWSG